MGLAQIAAVTANSNRDPKQRKEPYSIEDFMVFDRMLERRMKEPEREVAPADDDTDQPEGAKIDPNLVAWLFYKSGASVH